MSQTGQKDPVVLACYQLNVILAIGLLGIYVKFGVPGEPCIRKANLFWNLDLSDRGMLQDAEFAIWFGSWTTLFEDFLLFAINLKQRERTK